MDRFSREDLRALLANRQTPCVSFLMRTTRGVAINVAEAFAYGDEPPRREAVATGTRPSRPRATFETAGLALNPTREGRTEYLHQVDRGLRELLGDEEAPLVLAGEEDVLAA